jgi:hypothetical protein
VSSDGGALLLREVANKIDLLPRLAACFTDGREPGRIEHTVEQLLSQRVYALALGYEDLNDHDRLRFDPLLSLLSGQREPGTEALAGKSTLNRLELTLPGADAQRQRYKKILFDPASADQLLLQLFIEAHPSPPPEIVLDLDATDDPLHGKQEGRFFHGYYGHYCYLPLYVFCGDHLLCARLRTANGDASVGVLEEIQRLVSGLRQHWPGVRITLRADSGFCREELMHWCEGHQVDYVFGLARNRVWRRGSPIPSPRLANSRRARVSPLACFASCVTRHARAGRENVGSSGKPSIWTREPTRASSSPRFLLNNGQHGLCTKISIVLAARWKTGSKNSFNSLPIASARIGYGVINCACT